MAKKAAKEERALPPRARGRKEDFIARFEELVLSGRFSPGDRLPPERDLAESLGASRPVVHAALGELASRGLLRIESRKGVFVSDWKKEGSIEILLSLMSYSGDEISPAFLESMLEMRLLFETETARLAAQRRTGAQMDEIEKVVARERLLEDRQGHGVTLLDYDFHLAVAIASGNEVYPLIMNSMRRIYHRILDRFYADPSVVPEVFRLHRALARAIAEGRAEDASGTMRDILVYGESNLRRILAAAQATPVGGGPR